MTMHSSDSAGKQQGLPQTPCTPKCSDPGRSFLCWTQNLTVLQIKQIQKLLQVFFSFVTNRTNHRANAKAAGNCSFDTKILLWFNEYQWEVSALLPASNSMEMEIPALISHLSPTFQFLSALTEMWGSSGSAWIRDSQKGVRAKLSFKEFRKPRVLLNHHRHNHNSGCLLPYFLSGARKCQSEMWILQGSEPTLPKPNPVL